MLPKKVKVMIKLLLFVAFGLMERDAISFWMDIWWKILKNIYQRLIINTLLIR